MTKQEIVDFMNRNHACHLATVEGSQPRVRGMMMYRADDKGILFHTGYVKDLFKQVKANPKVEVCFNNFDEKNQVRVTGVVEVVEDQKLKEEIVAARPFMQPWVKERGYGFIAVLRVTRCEACVWTFDTNMAPKNWIKL